ncbi:hypothetical protein DSL72_000653 [Monilinia vaccinii-corymbosi]|uniref:Uncharacterized protein n=1 Tax=Monilinia vaccinii-corymbosi TaxID=61207 RepID=A0A8A3P264_9HELO|nr:hypothetical protein DSL72_000653 [Monilinia vaccinii-corymbosi]
MSRENNTLTAGDPTICRATETFQNFCGHISRQFTHHSALCESNQKLSRPSTRSGRSRSSTLTLVASKPGTAPSEGSADGTLTRLSHTCADGLRSIAGSITGCRETRIDPACTFSFTAQASCPKLLIRPLHSPLPCASCAQTLGMGPEGTGEREMTAEEVEELEKNMVRLRPSMQIWAAKMNDWDNGIRVLMKG